MRGDDGSSGPPQWLEDSPTTFGVSKRFYPTLATRLLDDYLHRVSTGEQEDSLGGLTEREREVLKLIAEGNTSREIAEMLILSVNTIDRHRANIMQKLNLHSKTELVKYAIRKGLVTA